MVLWSEELSGDVWGTCDKLMLFMSFTKEKQAIPLQAWTGPEGSRRVRLPDFKTIGT